MHRTTTVHFVRPPLPLAALAAMLLITASCSKSSHNAAPSTPTSTTIASEPGSVSTTTDAPPNAASVPDDIAAAGTSTPTGTRHDVPASIDARCGADVTDSLQSWLDTVPDNSLISLPGSACYRIEGTLRLDGRKNLLIYGNNSTLRATTAGTGSKVKQRNRSQLVVNDSSNITIRQLTVKGANPHGGTSLTAYRPEYEAQHAFSLTTDDGVFLDRVQAYDTYGDFVNIGGSQGGSKFVTVARGTFARSGRQGMSITNAQDVRIVGNQIRDVARSMFDIELNRRSGAARRVRIESNTTGATRNFWLANKGASTSVGDITVRNNVQQAPSGGLVFVWGPSFGTRGPFVFENNNFRTTGGVTDEGAAGLFTFSNVRDVTLRNNSASVPANRNKVAVQLLNTSNVLITGNQFTGTTKPVQADSVSKNVRVS